MFTKREKLNQETRLVRIVENSKFFNLTHGVHKVEEVQFTTLKDFMSTKWKIGNI